ncbi:50S ribosomal protein L15 [Candidatus Roizmanbacteria bacterium CG11_big_fil_rev_8_21_14_0_20_36_8]|uniref:Large ribosomal subunit protein uL15 n=2 Tax=Candidatus Roizmaniibacteriota TaxID=1752723 RepID=A0A2M6IV94_9BACT|nr:MAG: 50S ribosomal protein L15 [Candidatus Roizmanbacteria bacterium CG11_big_fil_rev_8_21_14_0_20_36_8]PIZ64870.1 MAG: 50S ribosomal protein L15 [Candidatus Roizmanbacteria bacterium CG_4_10_14_0_2_um_filter_36_9]
MSTLHELPKVVSKQSKRKGRGYASRKGAKSGRGTTRHQKARTDIPLHFEGGQNKMVKRFPLLRGKGKNKSIVKKPKLITLNHLMAFKKGDTVDVKTLLEKGFITEKEAVNGVKLLGTGKITIALTVVLPVSKAAKESIEKAGGIVK